MSFAVLEKVLADLPTEKLARAFERLPNLTKQDAVVRAKDAAGVLATQLSQGDADILRQALGAEGIASLIIDQASLPVLPKARTVRRAIPQDDGLVIFDPLGRPQKIAWPSITMLAAGNVREADARRERLSREVVHEAHAPVSLSDLESKHSIKLNLMLEILLSCDPHRCCIEGNTFTYEYLGARRSNRTADNFVTFLRDIVRHCPNATRNRGLGLFLAEPPKAMTYPSRHAFEQELVWLLWMQKRPVGVA